MTFTTNTTTGIITTNSNAAQGITRAYGGKGAFISEWVFKKSDLSVVRAGDLIKAGGLLLTDGKGGYRPFDPTNDFHLSRFCSADLPAPTAFFNPSSGKGTQTRIFLAGEEDGGPFRPGQGGRAFGTIVTGPDKGTSYELPYLGKFAWENAVASPFPQDRTVVMGLDDSELTNSHVYVYLGQKQTTGLDIQKAGLVGGSLHGIRVEDNGLFVRTETNDKVLGARDRQTAARFVLHSLGDVSRVSGDTQDNDSLGLLTNFQRVEDGAWDPLRPYDFYFITTGRVSSSGSTSNNVTNPTRLWRVSFDDIARPELGGVVELVLDGPAGVGNGLSHTQPVMMDNLGFTREGNILIQEDPGNYERLAKVWLFNPVTQELTEVAAGDPKYFTTGGAKFITRHEESSGIIDVSDILGEGWFIWDVQVHNRLGGELVENGQIVAMRMRSITAFPSVRVPPVDQNVTLGNSLNSSVAAAGTGPFTYQWFWNGQPIVGATEADVTLYNLVLNQAGDKLSVRITGALGSVTSQAATIKVNPATGQIAAFALHPVITVNGTVGGKYRVEYRDGLNSTSDWKLLFDITLTQPTQRVMDDTTANNPLRVYRVVTP